MGVEKYMLKQKPPGETRYTLLKWKESREPDYMHILKMTAAKQFITVVRRLIQYEKLKPEIVHHIDSERTFDVVMLQVDRLVIVRHMKGTTKAYIQEFERDKWELLTAAEMPNLVQFLTRYSEQVKQLDEQIWLTVKYVEFT